MNVHFRSKRPFYELCVLYCFIVLVLFVVDVHYASSKRQAAIFTAPVSSKDGAFLVIRVWTGCKCDVLLLFRRSNVLL